MAATNPLVASDLIHKYGWDVFPYLSAMASKNALFENQVLFVDVNHTNALDADDGVHGHTPGNPLASISYAVNTLAQANATIFVAAGDYDDGETIAVAVNGLKLIGPGSDTQNKAMVYGNAGEYDLMTINANEVVIDGIAFSDATDTYDGIVIGGSSASYKVTIRNCRLDGWDGEYGIQAGAVNDCPDLLIENNLFRSWNTVAIQTNCTRACIRNNIFHVVTDKIGIEHVPTAGNRPDNVYIDNYFCGAANSGTTGIKFTGTPTAGLCICAKNIFAGTWDTSITANTAQAGVSNYVADGSGGALIDCNSAGE